MSARERVIVGLSGGVDSAVSALLLQQQGYDVHGLFMRNWEDDDTETHCTAEEDMSFARQVCDELAIPLHRVNFAREYREQVFEHCLTEFRAGRTPNPDVLCNRHIKFRAFADHARRLDAHRIATGHYARLVRRGGHLRLLRGADANKDQSYFLHALSADQLTDVLFPLGELDKPRVRELAEAAGFDNFDRKDSTGICFIGERDFGTFLARYIATEPGPIVTEDGTTVGEHRGLAFYTIGQRRGLTLGGMAGYDDTPWYVVDKDLAGNRLLVAQGHDHPSLLSDGLMADAVNWIAGAPPTAPFRCTARTRYRQHDQGCWVEPLPRARMRVLFDRPQRAVAPGQSVVLYRGAECLGGGVIESRFRLEAETRPRASA